jgi:DNA-binding XRE family transcriptional regulator
MKKSPADRLKELREKRFETAKSAADAHGWNEVTYRSHESGGRNIPMTAARKYAAAFRSTPGYILGLESGGNSEPINSVLSVPVVAVASAGAFRLDDGLDIGDISVPAVPRHDIPAGVQYSVRVDGQSVNKRISDGAFAICAPYDKFPGGAQHGQLVHVVRERSGLVEHTIKELRYERDGAKLIPVSTDPKHQEPLVLSTGETDEIVRIQGVVIGIFQPL